MSRSTSPRVVCFDLGGVLVRICRSWDEACVQAQLPFRDALAFASEAMRTRRKDVVDRYQRGDLESDLYYAELSLAVDRLYSRPTLTSPCSRTARDTSNSHIAAPATIPRHDRGSCSRNCPRTSAVAKRC